MLPTGSLPVYVFLIKKAGEKVTVAIPELKINAELTTDAEGKAETVLNAKKLQRWSPEEPKLYGVTYFFKYRPRGGTNRLP